MKLKVETPLEETVDVVLDGAGSVAALRARFEQLNLPTEDYVFRRKGKKRVSFEDNAEFEMVHKDDVVDEKEFDVVLKEAEQAQVEIGQEVVAQLGLDALGGGGDDGPPAEALKDEDAKAFHDAVLALIKSPSDAKANKTFHDAEYAVYRRYEKMDLIPLFDLVLYLTNTLLDACDGNAEVTTNVFFPQHFVKEDTIMRVMNARLTSFASHINGKKEREKAPERYEQFHTAERHRRYFAMIVKEMKTKILDGPGLPNEIPTYSRAVDQFSGYQITNNLGEFVRTPADMDLLRRLVAQVSQLKEGAGPDPKSQFSKDDIYTKPFDRVRRFLWNISKVGVRQVPINGYDEAFDMAVWVLRVSAFMEPDVKYNYLGNALYDVTSKNINEPFSELCERTENVEETANEIYKVYEMIVRLVSAVGGDPIAEVVVDDRINLYPQILSDKVLAAFLKKMPDLLRRIAEFPRPKNGSDYPKYPERLMGDARKKKDEREEYIKKHAGARRVALKFVIHRIQVSSEEVRRKESDTMIEIVGGLLKACLVAPSEVTVLSDLVQCIYLCLLSTNVGKIARKNLFVVKNKDILLRVFKHLTALYTHVPEEIPGFPTYRKDKLVSPMNSLLQAFGGLIAKHKESMTSGVGVLLGFVIRMGAEESSGFMQTSLQPYATSNPDKLAPYVEVMLNGLKQEGKERALAVLPVLQALQFQHSGRALSKNVGLFVDIIDCDELQGPMGMSHKYPLYSIFEKIAEFNPKALKEHVEDLIEIVLADTSDMMMGPLVNALRSYAAYDAEPFLDKIEDFEPLLLNRAFSMSAPLLFSHVARHSEEKAEYCIGKLANAVSTQEEMFVYGYVQAMIVGAQKNPELLKPHAAIFEKLKQSSQPHVQTIGKQGEDFMNGTNVDDQLAQLFKAQDDLAERVEHVEEEMKEVKQDLSVLTEEMTEVRDTLEVHSAQISQVQKDVTDNKEAIDNVQVNVDISELEIKVAEAVREDINKLSLRVDQQDDALEALDAQVSETKDDVEQAKAEMKLNFDQLQHDLDKRMGEFQKKLDEAAKSLPIPSDFTQEKQKGGIKVALVLHFECKKRLAGICEFVDEQGEKTTFKSKTTFVNKWLKVAVAAVQVGVAVATQNAGKALKGLHSMWKNANTKYDLGFDAFVNQPFLLSTEQDEMIKQLRKAKFFEAFQNVEQQWICVACAKENCRVQQKEQRKKDFELQKQRLEGAKKKEEDAKKKESKAKKAANKAKELAKKHKDKVVDLAKDKAEDMVKDKLGLGDDEEGEGEEEEGKQGDAATSDASADVAKQEAELAAIQKKVDEDEEQEAAAKSGGGVKALNVESGDAQGEASQGDAGESGDDDKEDEEDGCLSMCSDCVIQ